MSDCQKLVEILDLIIDSEATQKDKDFFYKHIDKCAPCLDHYEVEKDLKDFIQESVQRKDCPDKLKSEMEKKMKELFAK